LLSDALVTNAGSVASAWVSDPGSVARLGLPEPGADVADRYLADLEVNGGNSGGPVYTQGAARVIGVCVATQSALVRHRDGVAVIDGAPLVYSSGLTLVVPSKYVVALLQRNGITWENSAAPAS
jgi:hypothetical protein